MKNAMKQKAAKQDTNSENPQKLSVKERFEERLSLLISYLEENLKGKGNAKIPVLKETKQGKNKAGPGTVLAALKTVKDGRKALVETMNKQVELGSVCLNKKLNGRALERDFLTNEWPWPEHLPAGVALKALIAMTDPTPPGEIDWSKEEASSWPPKAAPLKVAEWAQKKLDKFRKGLGKSFLEAVKDKQLPKQLTDEELELPIPTAGLALLYLAKDEITEGLKRPAIHLDAGVTNHDLTLGWKNSIPKYSERPKLRHCEKDDRLEILKPGDKTLRTQVRIPYDNWPLNASIVEALVSLTSPFGFRNWLALLRLFSVEGARQGWVRWTMKDHLDALGVSKRVRENPKTLEKIAALIELFTELKLVTYNKDGKVSEEAPLIHVKSIKRKLEDSRWQLDGVVLQINPYIYEGVRNQETGELGKRFFPVPIELARVDHKNNCQALMLGGLLPFRWHWNMFGKEKLNHVALTGKNLLDLANIKTRSRHPGEAWEKLDKALEILKNMDMLGHYKWRSKPRTDHGVIELYPHDIWIDRTIGGLKPIELPPLEIPRTGAELKEWRKKEGLTQKETAKKLNIASRTLRRAETNEKKHLGKSILRGFEKLAQKEDDQKKEKNDPSK